MRWPIRWEANWIWAAPAPAPVSQLTRTDIPPRDTWNRFCCLRRTVELEAVPESVPARVTADSRFVLYINGVEVGRGPSRSIPERLAWSEFDLARQLRPGRNSIAALVRYYGAPGPWWFPAPPSYQLGFGSFAFEAPAIGVSSDAGWKGRQAPYRQHVARIAVLPTPPTEVLNGAQMPLGWQRVDYDDSGWDAAVVLAAGTFAPNRTRLPLEPYTAPEADGIESLTALDVSLTEIARQTVASIDSEDPLDAYPAGNLASVATSAIAITYDAGEITLATPWLDVRGRVGAIVDIYAGEELAENQLVEINPRRYAMRYMHGGSGLERADAFEAVGFRYLTVLAREGASVEAVGAVERRYPRAGAASFECDIPALNRIWRVGARTLELCSTDAFIDCPGREQRAWVGDSYVHALLTYTTSTDWRLVRRHLRICAQSRRGDGLLAMVAAGDFSLASTTIPDYSLHWLRALARYFEYSGDAELICELLPSAIEIVCAFERYRAPDGLIRNIPGWVFIDWAMTERGEATAALDALYAAALADLAEIAGAAGDKRTATLALERASQTRLAFETYWDHARGVYVDAADKNGPKRRVSQQTNAAAIVGGCVPQERLARILEYILDDSRVVVTPTISDNLAAYLSQRMDPSDYVLFDPERAVVAAQPFFSHLLHDAIVRAGRPDLIPARCMRWWPQIQRGNTCFEEYWFARPGSGSKCHAWSATPTYDLTAYVLGVRPTSPGFRTVEIAPRFGKDLENLRGRVPTPYGMIEIELNRRNGGEIILPEGVIADLRFEDAALRGGELSSRSNRIAPSQ